MFDHPLTKKEVEELLKGLVQEEVPTNQEDVPKDMLDKFPDFIRQHGGCPRCGKNIAREQITDTKGPLRFRCLSCHGVSLMEDWK